MTVGYYPKLGNQQYIRQAIISLIVLIFFMYLILNTSEYSVLFAVIFLERKDF